MDSFNLYQAIQTIAIAIVPMVLGMMLHEVAHGWMAYKMGDPTAKLMGRLSFNPSRHIDPMGTACFILTAILSTAAGHTFIFGWAKPVPINPINFRNLRQGIFLVSLAGAVTNLILAFLFTLLLRLLLEFGSVLPDKLITNNSYLVQMFQLGVIINCILAWFNLLPIPPLDGSKVVACLMPPKMAASYMSIERYGMIIVILLLMSGLIGRILSPLIDITVNIFTMIVF